MVFLAGGCSAPGAPSLPAPSMVRVAGETVELEAPRVRILKPRPDLQVLLVDVDQPGCFLHLALTAPGTQELPGPFRYRRPPDLPRGEEAESWMKLGRRTLDAVELEAVASMDEGALAVRLEGTLAERGRTLPVELRARRASQR